MVFLDIKRKREGKEENSQPRERKYPFPP